MAVRGSHRPLYGKFKFLLYIDSFASAAFSSMSAVTVNVDNIDYREGGALVAWKVPGLVNFDDVTFARGVSTDEDFYKWVLDVVDVLSALPGGKGKPTPDYLRNLRVEQLDRDNSVMMKIGLKHAYPTKYQFGEWDNSNSEVTMEEMTVAYSYATRVTTGKKKP